MIGYWFMVIILSNNQLNGGSGEKKNIIQFCDWWDHHPIRGIEIMITNTLW